MTSEKLFSVHEVASLFNVSISWLYKQVEKRNLKHFKFGTNVRIAESHLTEFLKQHEQKDKRNLPVVTGEDVPNEKEGYPAVQTRQES
jgi:excisionase family DNA binding protein